MGLHKSHGKDATQAAFIPVASEMGKGRSVAVGRAQSAALCFGAELCALLPWSMQNTPGRAVPANLPEPLQGS